VIREPPIYCFGQFQLDPINQELWRGSQLIEVRRKAFEVLLYLVRSPRRLITREELLNGVWNGSSVSSSLLRAYIWELRRVLGDTASAPRYLETLSGRGYRFLQQVRVEQRLSEAADDNGADDSSYLQNDTVSDHETAVPAPSANGPGIHHVVPHTPALVIGVLHSLVGTMAYSESPVVDATLFAIHETNRRGGLLGRRVEAIVADGKSKGATFARQAECLLAERKVSALFGCWMSAHRKQVLPIVEKYNGLMVYPVQYEGLEHSPNVFYIGAAPNQQIIPAIRWAFGFLNCRRLFLIGSDYIFPRVANQIVRDQANRIGAEIVGEVYLPSGSLEVRDLVHQIAAAMPDLIVNTINGDSNIAFFRTLRAAGITPATIPTLSFSIGENELRNLDICGDYAAWNYFQTIERRENQAFLESFRSRYGPQRVTSDPMEAAYVGVNLWAQAVTEAGSVEPSEVRAALRHQSFNAPEGVVHIDPDNQHTWKTIRIGKVREDSQFEVIYSSEKPIRPEPYPDTRSTRDWNLYVDTLLARSPIPLA